MSNFKPSLITLALISSGVAFSMPLYAAEDEAVKKEAKAKEIETIEVTGFRRSIVQSMNTKRFATGVVDAISAEDIGKLPDSSIAESIARLPGISAQRLDGRASKITLRGFGENESGSTFNGRDQVSIDDNRGVLFDLYPSEIMSGVTVYKTPSASLEAEGIAGVVDMQTVQPLSKDSLLQINGQFEKTGFDKLNPDGENSGFRGTFTALEKFADDTIGVAVSYTNMSSPSQEKRWNAWGYPEFTVDGEDYSVLGGAKPYVRSSTFDRESLMVVIEALPTDNVRMIFDALYVDFSEEKILRGIEIPFVWGQGSVSAGAVDADTGFITQAQTVGQRVVVRNDLETRDAILTSFGLNTKWDVNETLMLDFDVAYSGVKRDVYSVESYSGTGRGNDGGVADTLGYTFNGGNTGATFSHELDYSDYGLIQLGGPLSWGGSSALNDAHGINDDANPLKNTAQDGFINTPSIEDELTSLKIAATQQIDNEIFNEVSFGISHRDRDKSKVSEGWFMTLKAFPGTLEVPEEYRLGTASLDFIGMGDMIAYDTKGLIDDGYYSLIQESLTNQSHATKSWSVQEKITAAFVQANIDTEVADLPLTGNIGLRYVHTKQSSQGSAFQTIDGVVSSSPTSDSHSYSKLLPSINLTLQLDDTQTLRFGAGKTISRARLDEMNSSVSVSPGTSPDDSGNWYSITGGNVELEPKEAIGYDLSYENYFSDEGYFSIAYFRKDLQNWIFDGNFEVDLTGVNVEGSDHIPADANTATGTGKVNGGEGSLTGYELAVTLPFNIISDSLDGFGLIASHTGLSSNIKDQNGDDYSIPGLSDSMQSLTFYYDLDGLSARASMRRRDDFKGEVYGLGFNTSQVDILGETIWDAQIGYNFEEAGIESLKGLSLTLQVQNLTEEPFTTTKGNALQVSDYQDYGRSFLLGFAYKF